MFRRTLLLTAIAIVCDIPPSRAIELSKIQFVMSKAIFRVHETIDAQLINDSNETVLSVCPDSCCHSLQKLEYGRWRIIHRREFSCWQRITYHPFEQGTSRKYSYSPRTIALLTENQPAGSYRIFVQIAESRRSKPQTVTSAVFRILE